MVVYEGIFHSGTPVFHYIEKLLIVLSNFLPFVGAIVWYGSWLGGIYTDTSDMHRAGMILVAL